MSILVTGGAGYIGSHTTIELLESGYDVIIADNLSNSSKNVIDRIETITEKEITPYFINLLDKKSLEQIFVDNQISSVIHGAGFKAVGESVEFPMKYYTNNLISTLNLCEVMDKYHVNNLIFSSSATVYGFTETLPVNEETPIEASNPYGRTKLMIEQILNDLALSNSKWKIALLRYFNPVGAHPSGMIGESPKSMPNNLMPYIAQVASGKLSEVNIFGGDYPTKDGTGVRDYIHVVDLSKGHVKALENINKINGAEAYNLGTGIGYSVLDVINTFEEVTGINIPYNIVDRRPGDIATSYGDPTKASEKLAWKTEKSLFEMCEDAWEWEKNNLAIKR